MNFIDHMGTLCPFDCDKKILKWVEQVNAEYPGKNLDKVGGEEIKRIVYNLYSDKYFLLIFKESFDDVSPKTLKKISTAGIHAGCTRYIPGNWGELSTPANDLLQDKRRLRSNNVRLYGAQEVLKQIKILREARKTHQSLIAEVDQVSFKKLVEIKENLSSRYQWLFDSEKKAMSELVNNNISIKAKNELKHLQDDLIARTKNEPPSYALILKLENFTSTNNELLNYFSSTERDEIADAMLTQAELVRIELRKNWNWGDQKETGLKKHEEYTDYYREKNYTAAIPSLEWLLENIPDLHSSIYINGARIYKELARKTEDPNKKGEYYQKLLRMYDKRIKVFGQRKGLYSRKLVDAIGIYLKDKSKYAELYQLSKEAFRNEGNEMLSHALRSYAVMAYKQPGKTSNSVCQDLTKITGALRYQYQTNEKVRELDKTMKVYKGILDIYEVGGLKKCGIDLIYLEEKSLEFDENGNLTPNSLYKRALNAYNNENYERALPDFKQAHSYGKESSDKIFECYKNLGYLSNANQWAEEAYSSGKIRAFYAAIYFRNTKQWDKHEQWVDKSIAANETFAGDPVTEEDRLPGHVLQAYYLAAEGKDEQARSLLKRPLESEKLPKSFRGLAYETLGLITYRNKEYKESAGHYKTAISNGRNVFDRVARSYAAAGDYAGALLFAEKASEDGDYIISECIDLLHKSPGFDIKRLDSFLLALERDGGHRKFLGEAYFHLYLIYSLGSNTVKIDEGAAKIYFGKADSMGRFKN